MSYVVLARKWRPKHFDEVVGQGHVARTLKNSIAQDRVAHAYLFTGARGVGKTSTARILAKALNCQQGPTDKPCYQCNSCTEILRGQSVDVFEIDGASNRGINEIRELREGVRYAPSRDRYKIYIIDEVHMLTTEAFNALLKTLEEPPAHAIFLFATTEPQKIPVTILSRCQRFDFKRIGQRDIVEHLSYLCKEEQIEADHAALQLIARQASGGMRDAVSLLDQIISFAGKQFTEAQIAEILGVANRRHLFELSEAIFARQAGQALTVLEEVNSYGYDLQQFAAELVNHLRDLMVVAVVEKPETVTDMTSTELANAKAVLENHGVSAHLIHRYFSLMVKGAQDMHRSVFPKLIFEMILVRMAQLEPLVGLDLLIDKLQVMEDELATELGIEPDCAEKKTAELTHLSNHLPSTPVTAPPVIESPVIESPVIESPVIESPVTAPPAIESPSFSPPGEQSNEQVGNESIELNGGSLSEELPSGDAPGLATAFADVSIHDNGELEAVNSDSVEQGFDARVSELPEVQKVVDAATLSPVERWAEVIAYLMTINKQTAATYEHAYVHAFDDGEVVISFEEKYIEFAREQERLELVTKAICDLFGERYKLRVMLEQQPESVHVQTLAQEREAETERRRNVIKDDVRNNPVVQKAQSIFDADELYIRVELADD